jgi:RimJ/RimL family protein N-acetyltransferase
MCAAAAAGTECQKSSGAAMLLVPFTEPEFHKWQKHSVESYAESKKRAGQWGEDAIAKSWTETTRMLPAGFFTPDNYFFGIHPAGGSERVGVLWVAIGFLGAPKTNAWLCDIEIWEPFRRQGHARQAIVALKSFLGNRGVERLGLNVFGFNKEALHLYESLGFEATAIQMATPILASV